MLSKPCNPAATNDELADAAEAIIPARTDCREHFPESDAVATAERGELLALALQESGTGVWDRNVATGEIYYSTGWKRLFGYDEADVGSQIIDSVERVHPDDRAYVLGAIQAHFDLVTPVYQVEHRLRCKDGSYKWVRSQGRVVSRDAAGRALRMVGTTIDITETRELATRLRDAAELVRLLTDEIPGMVYTCQRSPQGFITFSYLSAGARDIYEVEPEAALRDARVIFSRIHPEDLDNVLAAIALSEKSESTFHYEHRVTLPKKGVRWVLVSARPKHRPEDGTTIWNGIVTDVTDRKENEIVLNQHATKDFLTQLSNRRFFIANLEREMQQASVTGKPGTVLMCDLDHFKNINDTYGHPVGDQVLQSLARIVEQNLRKNDLVGRVGGEEFAVYLPDTGAHEAMQFAARLQRDLATSKVVADRPEISVTVSIGIAVTLPGVDTIDTVLARSDRALYLAKNGGRNQAVVAADPM